MLASTNEQARRGSAGGRRWSLEGCITCMGKHSGDDLDYGSLLGIFVPTACPKLENLATDVRGYIWSLIPDEDGGVDCHIMGIVGKRAITRDDFLLQ